MKLKIEQSNKIEQENIVTLKLGYNSEGGVNLIVTAEKGGPWWLLTINSDGTFTKHAGIGKDLGFVLNEKNQIIERN